MLIVREVVTERRHLGLLQEAAFRPPASLARPVKDELCS
jgi:hypothetical protein